MDDLRTQTDEQTARARELRRVAIRAEKKLWFQFRQGNKLELKIRRQHPFGPYYLDFYCAAALLALEIDGSSHDFREEYDAKRDAYLLSKGVVTLRFSPGVADEGIAEFVAWFRGECIRRSTELSFTNMSKSENED